MIVLYKTRSNLTRCYLTRNLPPPLKKQKIEESPSEIPDVLQGEIARLDQRFKVIYFGL